MFFGCRTCTSTVAQNYVFAQTGQDFLICGVCGAGYLSPGLSGRRLQHFYDGEYRQTYLYEVVGFSKSLFLASRSDLAAARLRVEAIMPTLAAGGAVWEIGSGFGAFVATLGRARPDLTIIATEPDEAARRLYDPPPGVRFENFETASAGRYDHVAAFHVLEHVEDPAEFLMACRGALKPGGRLTIEVPDYAASLADRAFAHAAHLSYFTPASLGVLARACGFEVLSCAAVSADARGLSIVLVARLGPFRRVSDMPGPEIHLDALRRVATSPAARWRPWLKALAVRLAGPRAAADLLRLVRLARARLSP